MKKDKAIIYRALLTRVAHLEHELDQAKESILVYGRDLERIAAVIPLNAAPGQWAPGTSDVIIEELKRLGVLNGGPKL